MNRSRLAAAGRAWLRGCPAVAQLAMDAALAVPYLMFAVFTVVGFATIPALLIGVAVLAVLVNLAYGVGFFERARLHAVLGEQVPPAPPPPETWSPPRRLLLDPRRWRALVHVVLMAFWGFLAGGAIVWLAGVSVALLTLPAYAPALPLLTVALPGELQLQGWGWITLLAVAGAAGLAATPFLARALVVVDVALVRWLLGPGGREEVARLSQRVETLTQTRTATVDSVEVERRRIERDLHDGPQQRLVAIAMDLGMAREKLGNDDEGTRELLDKAHAAAKDAITDMRQVARGIHPPVLTDRGLGAALSALAARSPVPVELNVDVPVRPSATVEAIAYFTVSEALTNVAKHSSARAARVDVKAGDGWLGVHVSDNGVGGADAARGTGLTGLADRARAVDGTVEVSSPPGGPTVLTVMLPTTARNGDPS